MALESIKYNLKNNGKNLKKIVIEQLIEKENNPYIRKKLIYERDKDEIAKKAKEAKALKIKKAKEAKANQAFSFLLDKKLNRNTRHLFSQVYKVE